MMNFKITFEGLRNIFFIYWNSLRERDCKMSMAQLWLQAGYSMELFLAIRDWVK